MTSVYDTRAGAHAGPVPAVRMASSTNAGIGAWLILAPFLLGYAALGPALWNDVVCGLWLVVAGLTRAGGTRKNEWLSWTNAGFGAWLVIAPFVLGYAARVGTTAEGAAAADPGIVGSVNVTGAIWNDVVVGILVAILGVYSALQTRRAVRDGVAPAATAGVSAGSAHVHRAPADEVPTPTRSGVYDKDDRTGV